MLLIDEEAEPDLPETYGVDDIPVIVQDKSFQPDGQLVVDPEGQSSIGFLGDTLVVNGTIAPYFEATTERVRLRLLNASNARVYDFGLADGDPFAMVASDGGFLEQPFTTDRIQLSPGERAEIVVDLEPGETVDVVSHPPDLGRQVDAQQPLRRRHLRGAGDPGRAGRWTPARRSPGNWPRSSRWTPRRP